MLFGSITTPTTDGSEQPGHRFGNRMALFMKRPRFEAIIGNLVNTTNEFLDGLGAKGVTDPFENRSFYGLVHKLTM